jgi:hypothetical protein
MILKANTAYNIGFTVNDATGLASDADSLPTASVYANTTEIVASGSVTVAKITGEDGCYTASFTTPESVTLGQTVKLLVKATVDTIASKAFINLGLFGKTVDELNDIAAGSAMTLTEAYDAAKTASSTTDVSSAASSINSNIDANETKIDTLGGKIDTIDNLVDGIAAELDTTPLSTLADKTAVDNLVVTVTGLSTFNPNTQTVKIRKNEGCNI